MAHRMWKSILNFALGTLYVLCVGEVFVRIFDPQPIVPRYVTGADYGIRTNIAGSRYRHFTPDVNVEYRINKAGFRSDVEYARDKPVGTCRVAMFGDSFMMGYEVELEDSIPHRLAELLRRDGKACEVINMAVSGFGTAEMLLALERNGLAYDPDIVVFQWHRSDFQDNVRSGLFTLEDGELRRERDSYLPAVEIQDALQKIPVYRFFAQYSQLYSAARETLTARVKNALVQLRRDDADDASAEAAQGSEPAEDRGEISYEARLGARLLQEAAEVVRTGGDRFVVLDIPEEQEDGSVESSMKRMDPKDLAGLEVVTLDAPLNTMQGAGRQIFYQNGQGHFTPLGYSIAAEQLFRAVASGVELARGRGATACKVREESPLTRGASSSRCRLN
jgi:hypothetical protein